MQIEFVLLILSILFFASILAGKAGSRFGVPALHLHVGDRLMLLSDNQAELEWALEAFGIAPQSAVKPNVAKP
jgi:NhaP-type Na+/H+ and K+/H+ antiporter